jgi:hypothetical protein
MPEIPLTRGLVTLVDDIDYERFRHLKWHANNCNYAIRTVAKRSVFLHNCIMDVSGGGIVDHINLNRLDNRRANLRITTRSGNQQNSFQSNNTSGMRGVSRHSKSGKWMLQFNGNYLGLYDDLESAAYAYNQEAVKAYGPHAFQNKLPDGFVPKKRKQSSSIAGYRGVVWDKSIRKWHARLGTQHIGTFLTPEEAAFAYNQVSTRVNGLKAFVNELPPEFVPPAFLL